MRFSAIDESENSVYFYNYWIKSEEYVQEIEDWIPNQREANWNKFNKKRVWMSETNIMLQFFSGLAGRHVVMRLEKRPCTEPGA